MVEPGIFLVHKSVGESSFDVVRRFQARAQAANVRKWPLGHGGTLDPFAEGLLLILSGQATRLMERMHPLPKRYRARVVWGVETDTCDHLGTVVRSGDAAGLTPDLLEEALVPFLGWKEQIPPATCAKKIGGEPAYKKAHRGETVELPPSRVYLHTARWVAHDLPRTSVLELTCRGGFYVRSLARDLGRALGCFAHLDRLSRTAIGPWEDPGADREIRLSGEAILPWCRVRRMTDEEADHVAHGRSIPRGEWEPPHWAWPEGFPLDPEAPILGVHRERLVALLRPWDEGLRTFANLRGGL